MEFYLRTNCLPFFLLFALAACELANEPLEEEIDYPFDYIYFEADGEELLFNYPWIFEYANQGSGDYKAIEYRVYDSSSTDRVDHVYISLNDSASNKRATLSFTGTTFFAKEKEDYPFTFDEESFFNDEGRMSLFYNPDLRTEVDTSHSVTDHINHSSTTWGQELTVTVTSFENMQIQGYFEGSVSTRSGSSVIEIRNGRFKANLEIID